VEPVNNKKGKRNIGKELESGRSNTIQETLRASTKMSDGIVIQEEQFQQFQKMMELYNHGFVP
jgi:hypothetical protein